MYRYGFLLCLFLALPDGCIGQTESIVFSGKIANIKSDPGQPKTILLTPPRHSKQLPVKISLDEGGFFCDTVGTGQGVYTLSDGLNVLELYLEEGKRCGITYDAENFIDGHVNITGNDSLVNRYFVEKMKKRVFIDRYNLSRSEENFRIYLNDIRLAQMARIEKYSLPPGVRREEEKNVEYDYLWELFFFTFVKSEADAAYSPLPVTTRELALNYEDEEAYKNSGKYASLADNYFSAEISKRAARFRSEDSLFSIHQNYFRLLCSVVKNEYIRNDMIEQSGRYNLRHARNKGSFYEDFKNYYTGADEEFKLKMDNDFLKYSRLKAGMASPEFLNYENYDGGTLSLRDLRGTFVYIDIWASWCGNCFFEMPYLKQLEEEYKGRNIRFVGISSDKSGAAWRSAILKNKMAGIQLRAGATPDEFFRQYVINGIPRYILLNANGEVVDYNAPRPSERDKITALFKSAGL